MNNPASFLAVEIPDESVYIYTIEEIRNNLRAAILSGLNNLKSNSIFYRKDNEEKWSEIEQPLEQIINQNFILRI